MITLLMVGIVLSLISFLFIGLLMLLIFGVLLGEEFVLLSL